MANDGIGMFVVVADDEVCLEDKECLNDGIGGSVFLETDLFSSDYEDWSDDADWRSIGLFLSDDEDWRLMDE